MKDFAIAVAAVLVALFIASMIDKNASKSGKSKMFYA